MKNALIEIQAGIVSAQRGEIYKCQPWASEGGEGSEVCEEEGFKDYDRWLFYIATAKDPHTGRLRPVGGNRERWKEHALRDKAGKVRKEEDIHEYAQDIHECSQEIHEHSFKIMEFDASYTT